MGLKRGPKIVTNGLILYLDAAITTSYPRSGNDWFDLSGNNNTATASPTVPVFSNEGGGSFSFNGSSNYFSINDSPSVSPSAGITILSWTKSTSYGDMNIVGKDNSYQNQTFNSNGIENSIFSAGQGWLQPRTNGSILSVSKWNHIAISYSTTDYYQRTYLNGLELTSNNMPYLRTGAFQTIINDSNASVYIGSWAGTAEFFNGYIASILIYNRALSASEVLQNFNAIKPRFNI
jgi:hypothetical protein